MTGADAYRRYATLWDIYFAVIAAAIAFVALFADDHAPWRRYAAVAVIAVMALLHLVAGRAAIRRSSGSILVIAGQAVLFAAAVTAVPATTWLLFALLPMIFQMVSLPPAMVLVVLVNLVPPVVAAFQEPALVGVTLLIAVISSAAGIWFGFWTVRVIEQSVERGLLIEELEATRAEVARLSHTAGVAEERARLAGEIHDTLAQGFTSIITLVQAADPALRDERLALAVRTAKENLAESRALIADLSPSALAQGSLPDSVRRQAGRFTEESGVTAGFRTTGDERPLPTAVEVVLLRAAQEALTNVRRHASAHEAAVLLAFAPHTVRLVVRDDGRGFAPGAADGFGLAGMRARAEQVNGTLTVHSDPATGTTIELEVPA